jgi:hypothetical protein
MSGMQFASNMITVLAWPAVVLLLLIVYRRWITSTVSSLTKGQRVRSVKIGPAEVALASDEVGRDVAGALATMPVPVSDGPVLTTLVDLIDDVNDNPRAGMRRAFNLVRQALEEFYPQLASVPTRKLARAMQKLVRRDVLSAEVEWAVSQLYQLLEMSESGTGTADRSQGYGFLMLAEGAIHAIMRSAASKVGADRGAVTGSTPGRLRPSWQGVYDDRFRIRLRIEKWDRSQFYGVMRYPDSGTITRVEGDIGTGSPDNEDVLVTWRETGYERESSQNIDFNGRYRATVSGDTMAGAWFQNDQPFARFKMTATEN